MNLFKDFFSFQDEILTVIRRVDENWAEGMLGDKIGIFPILYVEVSPTAACVCLSSKYENYTRTTFIKPQTSIPKCY